MFAQLFRQTRGRKTSLLLFMTYPLPTATSGTRRKPRVCEPGRPGLRLRRAPRPPMLAGSPAAHARVCARPPCKRPPLTDSSRLQSHPPPPLPPQEPSSPSAGDSLGNTLSAVRSPLACSLEAPFRERGGRVEPRGLSSSSSLARRRGDAFP